MAIQIRDNKLHIDKVVIDNELVVEYVNKLPQAERDKAIEEALGIGIMAALKGDLHHFLHSTEGQLGKHLNTLKAVLELKNIRFEETASKGFDAEVEVITVLRQLADQFNFKQDKIDDTSKMDGNIKGNKTGDILIQIDGDENQQIGLEVKLDKSVNFGSLLKRDPLAKSDTALAQLIETSANRKSKLNIIVFDEEKVDNTIKKEAKEGITYIPHVGFIVIVSTQKNNFKNLALAYVLSRELILSKSDFKKINTNHLKLMLQQLVKVLNDYQTVKNEAENIKKSAQKILDQSHKTRLLVEHSAQYLLKYLDKGEMSEDELWSYISPEPIKSKLELVKNQGDS